MKYISSSVFSVFIIVLFLFASCVSQQVDKKAQDLQVETLAEQVKKIVEDDIRRFDVEFKEGDKRLELTLRDNPDIRIEVSNPDPLEKRLLPVGKKVKFIGTYSELSFTEDQVRAIQDACNDLFENQQIKLIKERKKYHQID